MVLQEYFFFMLSLFNQKFLKFWVLYEIGTLASIMLFFEAKLINDKIFYNMLYYIVLSSLSSGLMMLVFLYNDWGFLFFFVLMLKVGLFPFNLWLMNVNEGLDWFLNFIILVFSKMPLLVFSGGIVSTSLNSPLVLVLLAMSWFYNMLYLLNNNMSLKSYYVMSSLSSGYGFLMFLGFCGKAKLLLLVFVFLLNNLLVVFSCSQFKISSSLSMNQLFSVLLLFWPMPLTFSFFYKYSILGAMTSSAGSVVLFVWLIYLIFEFYYVYSMMEVSFKKILLTN